MTELLDAAKCSASLHHYLADLEGAEGATTLSTTEEDDEVDVSERLLETSSMAQAAKWMPSPIDALVSDVVRSRSKQQFLSSIYT